LRVVPNSGAAARQHSAAAPGHEPRLERQGASVTRLHAPRPARPAVRLTRRGVLLVSCAVAGLAAGLVLLALASAPRAASSSPPPSAAAAAVIVHSGDSLWSIAQRIAPGSDPRQVVAQLERLNGLSGPALVPGQVLRTR
jgi:LysM repeat protein